MTRLRATMALVPRAAVLITGTVLCFALIGLGQVRASLDELMVRVGSEFMSFPGAPSDEVRTLHLNGGTVYFRSHTVDAPLDRVILYYRSACGARDAQPADRLAALVGQFESPVSSSLASVAARSWSDEARGYVACLGLGAVPADLDSLSARFQRFIHNGVLGEIGTARYVYAEALHDESQRTMVLTAWTDDLRVHDLVIREGVDTRGADLDGVPRPPRSQRILSSWEVGGPSALAVYLSDSLELDELDRFYRRAFGAGPWEILERDPGERVRIDASLILAARRGTDLVSVIAYRGDQGRSVITLLRAGQP